jgi:CheY-like chemotaxis protein
LLGVVWDVSKQRRDEDELQKLQTLQMVGTLAGGIAHDFNNILLRLFGNITMAMADLSKEHPSYAPLDAAQKAKEHAIRLTKQLLTFAKGGAPVKENIGLGLLVEEVARFNLSGSNVGLDCWQAEHLWQTQADKGQIQQVVANLVINARQAMPEGGHLHISLENSSLPPPVFPGLREGRYVKISLRDEGSGIDPSLLGRIFDPYFTTSQTGSGLGLATVWSIINRHGGHIGVVSALGEGTNFTFYLPASEIPRPAPAAPPLAAADPAQARSAKILVMDDDEDVLVLATRMLRRCGHSVVTAPGGKEALALYRQAFEAGEPFDAVIMDLTIPGGIGGRQAVGELLSFDPKARAIVSSGYSESPVMADPAAYGFRGAAVKPYDQSELSEIVALVLA